MMSLRIGSLTMKKPRVSDFDPNAVPTLGSPMDDMPPIGKQPTKAPKAPVMPPEPPIDTASLDMGIQAQKTQKNESKKEESASVRTPVRPYARTGNKRTITRYAFEFYQDQIDTLRQYSLEEKGHGEKGSMSEMVREALDSYIAKKNRTDE